MPVLADIIDRLQTVGAQAVLFALGFLATYLVGRLMLVPVVSRILEARQVNPTVRQPGIRAIHMVVVFVAVAIGLAVAGFTRLLSASSTLAAAITLAIGFAAREVIANVVSGVFIIADPEFNIGDTVRWDGKTGVVEDISFRVTRVRTFDNELMSVPNTELTTTTVTNIAAKERRRHTVTFGVGYGEDLEEARRIVREEAANNGRINERPSPVVNITELADSSVNLEALVWLDTAAPNDEILSTFRQSVKERFDQANIEMPYPYRELGGTIGIADERDQPDREPEAGSPTG